MNLTSSLLAVFVGALPLNAFAAAFQLSEHSATGLGRAFAGEAAIADSASVVASNPALMSSFKKAELSVVGTYILPDVGVSGESAPVYSSAAALDNDSIAPEALIPAIYYVTPINEKVAIGFGVFSNFGLATEFPEDYAAGQLAGISEITTVNLNASVSYQIDAHWSVGMGLNYIYAEANLVRHFGDNPLGLPAQTVAVDLEGDDSGYGWNAGLAYEINKGSRLGLHYRSKTNLTFEGDYTNQLPAALGGLSSAVLPGYLDLELPATAEFSGVHSIDTKWALNYSIVWTQWSHFESLEAYASESNTLLFSKKENFSNSFRYALGGSYQLDKNIKLRAGFAYDATPTDSNHLSISIPDSNRKWLSAGASYKVDKTSSVDMGLSIIKGDEHTFDETDNLGSIWTFSSKGDALIFSAQYNYKF
ncbi:outer membrane protein transport protein [Paraglaciecola arctica]|uniref:Long-chain fatty acid transport protein n=1 Tax=Paraglaciecola arctica BSs20135 TaxID=493475 RepID=K6XET8_9ALTE|nr:outer membrane protein transport protein [Paraglaciecola arctica]GAC19164.1 long-chain fatty acid transport protein [Paraglaciecola arctica BSs20135]